MDFGDKTIFLARTIQKGMQSVAVRSKNGTYGWRPVPPMDESFRREVCDEDYGEIYANYAKAVARRRIGTGFSLRRVAAGDKTVTPTPPPGPGPQGNFSMASLNGTYAFSMSGTDNSIFGNPIARIGSFHADGQGNITMAIEDVNDGGSNQHI